MAAFLAKFVGKKILGERLENKFGKEDPYFESVPATRLDGKPSRSKTKKRRKALPPGLSEHDAQILTKAKRRAYRLDCCLFSFMNIKFGWGSVIGLVPAFGDAVDALLALMVMRTCMSIDGGLPAALKTKMLMNIAFDFVLGLVPFLGDLADAVFRANTRNVILLEEHLRQQGQKYLRQSGQPIPSHDPSDPVEFDRAESNLPGSRQPSPTPGRQPSTSQRPPREPEAAEVRNGGGGGWFGRKQRPRDVEMGPTDNSRSNGRTRSQRSNRG